MTEVRIEEVITILEQARNLQKNRPYQNQVMAGIPDPGGGTRLRSVSPTTEGAHLSWRGAVIAAAGGSVAAWPVFRIMGEHGLVPRNEPANKQYAVAVLTFAIAALERERNHSEGKPTTIMLAETRDIG